MKNYDNIIPAVRVYTIFPVCIIHTSVLCNGCVYKAMHIHQI